MYKRFIVGIISVLCIYVCALSMPIRNVQASTDTKYETINLTSSTSQSQSTTVTIPNLESVVSLTSSTGSASDTISGSTITISTTGGTPSSSQLESYESSSAETYTSSPSTSSTGFPSTYYYSNGSYSGTLYATGVSSYSVQTGYSDASSKGANYTMVLPTDNFPPTYYYTDGTYSGTLYMCGGCWPWIVGFMDCYTGTVYGPGGPTYTTEYYENYSGTVYGWTSYYINNYTYTVTIGYTDNTTPTIAPTSPIGAATYSKDTTNNSIALIGTINDPDVGDVDTVKYTLNNGSDVTNQTNKVISTTTSDNTNQAYNYTIPIDTTIPDGSYTLKVFVSDNHGATSAINLTTVIIATTPTTPINISESSINPTTVTLVWNSIVNATSYNIYNDTILVGTSSTTSYTVQYLQQSTPYTFTVSACDSTLEGNQSLTYLVTTSQQVNSLQQTSTSQVLNSNLVLTDGLNYYDTNTKQTHLLADIPGLSLTKNVNEYIGAINAKARKIMIIH